MEFINGQSACIVSLDIEVKLQHIMLSDITVHVHMWKCFMLLTLDASESKICVCQHGLEETIQTPYLSLRLSIIE